MLDFACEMCLDSCVTLNYKNKFWQCGEEVWDGSKQKGIGSFWSYSARSIPSRAATKTLKASHKGRPLPIIVTYVKTKEGMCVKAGCVLRHKISSDSQEWHVALKLQELPPSSNGRVYLEISQCFMHHCLKVGAPHRATHNSIILLCQNRFWTNGLRIRPVDDSTIKGNRVVGVCSFVMFWSFKKRLVSDWNIIRIW